MAHVYDSWQTIHKVCCISLDPLLYLTQKANTESRQMPIEGKQTTVCLVLLNLKKPGLVPDMSSVGPNWVRLVRNGTNVGLFKNQFSVHMVSSSQNEQKTDLKKSQVWPLLSDYLCRIRKYFGCFQILACFFKILFC